VAAAGAGLLLATAFPPFDLELIALVALVPLLWAWRGAAPRQAALCGFVAGLAFFGVLVYWTFFFGPVAYLPFIAWLSLWWALAGAAVGYLGSRGVAWAPATAAVWVLIEAARARWPFGGFSWGEVGYAFHDIAPARSLASWGGVLGVSFLAVVTNALVLSAVTAARRPGGRGDLLRAGGALAAVALVAGLAHAARPDLDATGRLRVALVQGNDKNRELTLSEIENRYLPTNHFRLAAGIPDDRGVDLVVLPESSLDNDPRDDEFLDGELTALARRLDATVFAGGNAPAPDDREYNTTWIYRSEGRLPAVYRKRHLVPFGEFVPWRGALSFIDALDQIPTDYAPGRSGTVFPVPTDGGDRPVGILICFESAFSELARSYVRDGAEALVVSTNNRSFRRSSNAAQHLAIGQMRAAETGRPIIQAGISGITGLVDARGRVLERTRLFDPTVLTGEVTTTTGRTPYVRWGQWILPVSVATLLAAAARIVAARRP
jgi:apolipoprotein N-acyltransferase